MRKVFRILIRFLILSMLIFQTSTALSEPSRNMRAMLDASVSVMDLLCIRLEQHLQQQYEPIPMVIAEAIYELARKARHEDLIEKFKVVEEARFADLHFSVFFDATSNRLVVQVESHSFEGIEAFKKFWEAPLHDVAKDKLKTRYHFLHLKIKNFLHGFEFHKMHPSSNVGKQDIVKEMMTRLKIQIYYQSKKKGNPAIEYLGGHWKILDTGKESQEQTSSNS